MSAIFANNVCANVLAYKETVQTVTVSREWYANFCAVRVEARAKSIKYELYGRPDSGGVF